MQHMSRVQCHCWYDIIEDALIEICYLRNNVGSQNIDSKQIKLNYILGYVWEQGLLEVPGESDNKL